MIKVLIVDDSLSAQQLLTHILSADPEITITGTARNGREALEIVRREKPDVITMDIYMPEMDGFETTSLILETSPVPIIIASSCYTPEEVEKTFRAIEAGAVAILPKPGITDLDYEENTKNVIQTVKLMSEVKVVTRRARFTQKRAGLDAASAPKQETPAQTREDIKVIAIGASTGGPPVLQTILSQLPADFPVPILIVQHITPGFIQGMIDWLGHSTCLNISIACDNERVLPGHVYFAPDSTHMGIDSSGTIRLSKAPQESNLRPTASYLFRSVATSMQKNAVGVLLTGMGKDGAVGLKLMKDRGAITIAQDEESSVVHGMPGEAIKIGGATYTLPPDRIVEMLKAIAYRKCN